MKNESDYLKINKALWDRRTEVHLKSEFYGVADFLKGKSSLGKIELDLLGDVKGKSLLHLQCHFGMDTLSLARMGAKVTGIDLSDKAIAEANILAKEANLEAEFVVSDVYSLPENLKGQFDIVFTTYGTIGWLPDLNKWASVVNHFLKPGGIFLLVEFHPVLWMFDDYFRYPKYSYFNKGLIVTESQGTYADRYAEIQNEEFCWNHDLAEVMQPLMKAGLVLKDFQEFDFSPYDCFNDTVKLPDGNFQIAGLEGKLPMVYSMLFTKTE